MQTEPIRRPVEADSKLTAKAFGYYLLICLLFAAELTIDYILIRYIDRLWIKDFEFSLKS